MTHFFHYIIVDQNEKYSSIDPKVITVKIFESVLNYGFHQYFLLFKVLISTNMKLRDLHKSIYSNN